MCTALVVGMTRNLAIEALNRSSEDGRKEKPKLRVLAVTNMLPSQDSPHAGRFVQQQIEGLQRLGLDVEVLFVDRRDKGMRVYTDLPALLKNKVALFQPDIIHVMYGGIMAWLVTHVVPKYPSDNYFSRFRFTWTTVRAPSQENSLGLWCSCFRTCGPTV